MDEAASIAGVKERRSFFFSNVDVRQDAYLRKMMMKEDGSAGNVPIDCLLRFDTIKTFTKEAAVVVKAAKDLSDAIVLNDDETTISRKEPFTKDMLDGHIPPTLYLRNVPKTDEENSSYTVKVDDVRKLFDVNGKVAMTRLRFSTCPEDQADYDLGIGMKRKEFKRKRPTRLAIPWSNLRRRKISTRPQPPPSPLKKARRRNPPMLLKLVRDQVGGHSAFGVPRGPKGTKAAEDKEYEEKQSAKRKSGEGDDAADDDNDEPPIFSYD
jgi:hypothetical protein